MTPQPAPSAPGLPDRLRDLIRRSDDATLTARYRVHCQRLRCPRLRDTDAGARALIEAIGAPVTQAAALALLDESQALLARSPILTRMLDALDIDEIPTPTQALCVDALAYALLMERVTRACLERPDASAALLRHLDEQRAVTPWRRRVPWFHLLKLYSVLEPVRRLIDALAGGRGVRPRFFRWGVPMNILEAVALDWWSGATDNARLGLRLARRASGRAEIGPDGLLRIHQPQATPWADLYICWNIGFVLRFPDYPLALPKLLIPSVLAHRDTPGTFIHRRAIALLLQTHCAVFRRSDGYDTARALWAPLAQRRAWGRLSRELAQHPAL